MARRLTVVDIRSLSYSGTTWFNVVLGSNPRCLALAPPDRLWTLPTDQSERACQVHGPGCAYWSDFVRSWDRGGSFLQQLADYADVDVIVLNNPSRDFIAAELSHPHLDVYRVSYVRDGRANIHSFMRHHPRRFTSVYDVARGWLVPAVQSIILNDAPDPARSALIRHEAVADAPLDEIRRVATLAGIDVDPACVRFWEREHHLTAGNTGVLHTLRRMQGLSAYEHLRKDYYEDLVARLARDPDHPVVDTAWQEATTLIDRVAYDFIAGALFETFGYPRPPFRPEDVVAFVHRHDVPATRDEALASAPKPNRSV